MGTPVQAGWGAAGSAQGPGRMLLVRGCCWLWHCGCHRATHPVLRGHGWECRAAGRRGWNANAPSHQPSIPCLAGCPLVTGHRQQGEEEEEKLSAWFDAAAEPMGAGKAGAGREQGRGGCPGNSTEQLCPLPAQHHHGKFPRMALNGFVSLMPSPYVIWVPLPLRPPSLRPLERLEGNLCFLSPAKTSE